MLDLQSPEDVLGSDSSSIDLSPCQCKDILPGDEGLVAVRVFDAEIGFDGKQRCLVALFIYYACR